MVPKSIDAIPHDRGGFETTLDMLQRAASYFWTAGEWLKTTSLDVDQVLCVWQAPALLCTMNAYRQPHPSLLLRWWPLTVLGEAAGFLRQGEPDGNPQATLWVGFGDLPEEKQYPEDVRKIVSRHQWQRNKVKSQRWGFPPDGLDPLMEERQRAKRMQGKFRAQQDIDRARLRKIEHLIEVWRVQQEVRPPGPPFQRIVYVPHKPDEKRACFLMMVFLFQSGLVWREKDDTTLKTWAADYLKKEWGCETLGHAYEVFDTILRTKSPDSKAWSEMNGGRHQEHISVEW